MKLSSKAIELMNTHDLTARLMARGWSVYLPVYDEGIDLLAARNEVTTLIRIQVKSRWTIDKKYVGRNIEIAFPHRSTWFLVPHEQAVKFATELGYCARKSWTTGGKSSSASMSKVLQGMMRSYELDAALARHEQCLG